MYHRVIDRATDPWGLAVSPENFRAQLSMLKRRRTVLDLAALMQRADEGALPRDAVAITFDDGYLDNLVHAAPCLAAHDLPATLFLATGPMARQQPYWWEGLAAMILDAEAADVEVVIDGDPIRVVLPPREPLDADRHGWRAWEAQRTVREAVFWSLWNRIRLLAPGTMVETMDALAAVFPGRADAGDRPMSGEEVVRLLSVAPIRLGGHTVDHPDLTALSPTDARRQIVDGRRQVADLAGENIIGFSFPYGRHDLGVMQAVADAGYAYACTTQSGEVTGAPRFALPRMTARDTPDIDWLYG